MRGRIRLCEIGKKQGTFTRFYRTKNLISHYNIYISLECSSTDLFISIKHASNGWILIDLLLFKVRPNSASGVVEQPISFCTVFSSIYLADGNPEKLKFNTFSKKI